MSVMKDELPTLLARYGQQQLLAFWDELNAAQKASLEFDIRGIDFQRINRLYGQPSQEEEIVALAARATEPPAFRLGSPANRFAPKEARWAGVEALSAGEIGVVLVAGGQGTRLGFEHPKGMYPIGPVSEKSLFEILVQKIVATSGRFGARIPLYVMVSPATHEETLVFFAENDRFGLPKEDFHVFCQGTMPAVDSATGKVLLAEPGRVALSPDGHGGMLAALDKSGGLADLEHRGVKHLFYFQVDNPLVEVCSPEFLEYHLLASSELSSQVVAKRTPQDRVGNVVCVDGRLRVIEYSDLPDAVANRRREDGSLEIWAGSIAVHAMDVAFLRRMTKTAGGLPFHVARKKVPHVDSAGHRVEPTAPNAIKFERFIFDLMPSAENALVVEVDTARHFAPLKNGPGEKSDTAHTVRAQMIDLHSKWLRRAGARVSERVPVEISPLYALDAEQLAEKVTPGTQVTEATYFC